jgi:hypothetical protein
MLCVHTEYDLLQEYLVGAASMGSAQLQSTIIDTHNTHHSSSPCLAYCDHKTYRYSMVIFTSTVAISMHNGEYTINDLNRTCNLSNNPQSISPIKNTSQWFKFL